jgi:hypothetical protein
MPIRLGIGGVVCLASLALPRSLVAQEAPATLLERALTAAGGAERLARYRAFTWRAEATVHVPGRDISLLGHWQIAPPDSAIVATYETSTGPSSMRRLILAGDRGWSERGGQTDPLPMAAVTEERGQFYLYSLIRLLPLRDPAVELSTAPPDTVGHWALRVARPDRQEATLYFDARDRLVRIRTTVAAVADSPAMPQEVTLTGTIETNGVRWFRRMTITRDGQPFFEMRLTSFEPLRKLVDPLLAGPP